MSSTTPKPIDEEVKKNNVVEIGTGGARHTGGYLIEEEKDASLEGTQKYTTYTNILLNTSVVAASVRYYLNLVTKAGWRFTPSDKTENTEEAKRIADLVTDMMNDMETPFHRIVRRAAMYRFYGFSVHEWTAKVREDGNIGFMDVAIRPQRTIERWDIDEKGRVNGIMQRDANTAKDVNIPRWKLLYVVDDSINDNPTGTGLFRHLVYPARRLERYEQLEGYGFESDLRGVPVARAPLAELNKRLENGEITQVQYDKYLAPIMRFLKAHVKSPRLGMLLDSATYSGKDDAATPSPNLQWNIELLRGSPTSLLENANAIERINLEMARMMGTEHLLIGGDGKGSMALSTDKSHNFALIVESSLKEISESIKKDLLGALWQLNGWDPDLMPLVEAEPIRFRDPEKITSAILDLARAGAVILPDDPVVDALRDVLNIPRLDPEKIADPLMGAEEDGDDQPDSDTSEGARDNIEEDIGES